MRGWKAAAGALLWGTLLFAPAAQAINDYRCDNGANVDSAARCAFFVQFNQNQATNPRVLANMHAAAGENVRSIALIVGVNQYPEFEQARIPAAHADVQNLRNFLINDQQFDEVVVLENDDATRENISYFLDDYIATRSQVFGGRLRVLFAYSGHGVNGDNPQQAALVLNRAQSERDQSALLRLGTLRQSLQNVASESFQVVALINACYGGDIFSDTPSGGNDFIPDERGAHAVTAGSAGSLVWASGEPGHGSVFFDTFIKAVRVATESEAAGSQVIVETSSGQVLQDGNSVALGDVFQDVTRRMRNMRRAGHAPNGVPPPWMGSIEPDTPSQGAFFFLTAVNQHWNWNLRQAVTNPVGLIARPLQIVTSASIYAPPGPISVVPGRPELRVFNPPVQYPVQGLVMNTSAAPIDWTHARASGVQFVYFTAADDNALADAAFRQNLSDLDAAGLRFGVLHTFSFCRSAHAQADAIEAAFPVDADALPVVVDFTAYRASTAGARCDVSAQAARTAALDFLRELDQHYGKRPLVYSPRRVFDDLFDASSAQYPFWVTDFSEGGSHAARSWPGPWTLWQYTTAGTIDGLDGTFTRVAFFGPPVQFERFAAGASDIASAQ